MIDLEQEGVDDGDDDGGEHIGRAEGLRTDEVDADAEDEHGAYERKRLLRAAVVMMGESAPANNVIVPWNTATGRAEKMQPRPSEAVMVQTMMQSSAPLRASVDQSPSRPSWIDPTIAMAPIHTVSEVETKSVGELVIALAASLALEPFAKVLDGGFQVDGLADERTEGERDNEHGGAGGRQRFPHR